MLNFVLFQAARIAYDYKMTMYYLTPEDEQYADKRSQVCYTNCVVYWGTYSSYLLGGKGGRWGQYTVCTHLNKGHIQIQCLSIKNIRVIKLPSQYDSIKGWNAN